MENLLGKKEREKWIGRGGIWGLGFSGLLTCEIGIIKCNIQLLTVKKERSQKNMTLYDRVESLDNRQRNCDKTK